MMNKMMKKGMALGLALTIAMGMMACGNSTQSGNEAASETASETAGTIEGGNMISEYMDDGYNWKSYSIDGNELIAIMGKEDDSDFVRITVPVTEEEIAAGDAIDVFDEQYEEKSEEWLRTIGGEGVGTVESLMDRIPSQEELDELIGKTGADLEAMDYSNCGFEEDEDGNLHFLYSYFVYDEENEDDALDMTIRVWFEGFEGVALDDVSDEMIADSIVSKVEFKAFGQ